MKPATLVAPQYGALLIHRPSASGAFTNTAPEPTPLTLLAAGAASLLWMRRKAQSGEG